jgi:hypothetical protein
VWKPRDLFWLAGLFEGEGCISIRENTLNLVLQMADEDVVRRAHTVARFGSVTGPLVKTASHHRPLFRWKVSRRDEVYALLVAIYPMLGDRRREKARRLIRHYARMPGLAWKSHGTETRYKRLGCRCRDCRAAAAEARKRRKGAA